MSENTKKTSSKWLIKIKNIKHIEIYITIIFVVVLLLIYMSSFSQSDKQKKANVVNKELTVSEYVEDLEKNLEDILSNIGGVTNVKVMITLNMSEAEVIDSKINLNSFPEIRGVLITAKGVNNATIKMKVLHAVQAVIKITNGNIEILSSD